MIGPPLLYSDVEILHAIDWAAAGFARGDRNERALVDLYVSWRMTLGEVVLRIGQVRRDFGGPA